MSAESFPGTERGDLVERVVVNRGVVELFLALVGVGDFNDLDSEGSSTSDLAGVLGESDVVLCEGSVVVEGADVWVGVRGLFVKGRERLATGSLRPFLSPLDDAGVLGELRCTFFDSLWPDASHDFGLRILTDSELLAELSSVHIESWYE